MQRKTALLILLILLIISGSIFVYYSFFNNSENNSGNGRDQEDPFGSFFPTDVPVDDNFYDGQNPEEFFNNNQNIPKLRKITSNPVAGFISFDREIIEKQTIIDEEGEETESEITKIDKVFRYIERATGNVYETLSTTNSLRRITNTTIPKVYNAEFSKSGENLFIETLDEMGAKKTLLGSIKKEEKNEEEKTNREEQPEVSIIEGSFLPTEATNITLSKEDAVLYSVFQDSQRYRGVSGFYLTDFNKTSPDFIYSSPISEWLTSWIDESNFSLLTKPSSSSFGFLYQVNKDTGNMTKILDGKVGLNAIANSDYILYSEIENNRNLLISLNRETGEEIRVNLTTLPREKCVFSNTKNDTVYCASITNNLRDLPDSWYKGLVRTVDDFYQINLNTGSYSLLTQTSSETEELIDVNKIKISPNDEFLLFTNKRDLSFWSLDIID